MNESSANAISAAKEFWGRYWKSKLSQCWMTGKYPVSLKEHVPQLQQLRNSGYRL